MLGSYLNKDFTVSSNHAKKLFKKSHSAVSLNEVPSLPKENGMAK